MESSPHGLLGYGKVEIFWREIAWPTSSNYIAQLGLKKEISKQLSKKIFRHSLYNFLLQLTKAIMSANNSREILACRRQVLSRELREGERQRAREPRVEQAKTIAKESTLEVEEEDKILAKKVGN